MLTLAHKVRLVNALGKNKCFDLLLKLLNYFIFGAHLFLVPSFDILHVQIALSFKANSEPCPIVSQVHFFSSISVCLAIAYQYISSLSSNLCDGKLVAFCLFIQLF